ncbi:MAG: transglutaminase family protein [Pontimonas sp.]
MSRLRVKHTTSFTYEAEVQASYNETRMRPDMSDRQFLLSSQLVITPLSSQHQFTDYWGTRVTSIEILTPHQELSIVAESLVEINPRPPVTEGLEWGEIKLAPQASAELTELLTLTPLTKPPKDVIKGAHKIAAASETPDQAAREICEWINDEMSYVPGVTQVHSSAAEAWKDKQGVCQDISHITVGALRSAGIPARYVSGYLHPVDDAAIGDVVEGESHAWVEWWSGAFRGFDPTNRKEVGDRHVIVGRGRDYTDVPPLRGVYDGPATSDHHVRVELSLEH